MPNLPLIQSALEKAVTDGVFPGAGLGGGRRSVIGRGCWVPPVPGRGSGMVMLFAALVARGSAPDNLGDTANGLLTHLSLLFVPAGVGLMIHIDRIRGEALPIIVSLVVSTALPLPLIHISEPTRPHHHTYTVFCL